MAVFFWTHPTARVAHRCGMCSRHIRPSEQYHRMAGIEAGTAWTHKECRHCRTLLEFVTAVNCESEYGADEISDWEPMTMQEARVKAMYNRRWTRRAGSLFPIPKVHRELVNYGSGLKLTRPVSVSVPTGDLDDLLADEDAALDLDASVSEWAGGER